MSFIAFVHMSVQGVGVIQRIPCARRATLDPADPWNRFTAGPSGSMSGATPNGLHTRNRLPVACREVSTRFRVNARQDGLEGCL